VYVSPNLNIANAITVAYTRGSVTAESGGILESFGFQLAGLLAQTISFDPLPDKNYDDPDYPLVATASSGLPVTFSSSNSTVVSVTGSTASINNSGETFITAHQAGDATYAPASLERHQLVNKAAATIVLSDLSHDYTGFGVSATATTVPSGLTVVFTYNGSTDLPVDLGTYSVVAQIVDPVYDGSATDMLTISDLSAPVPDLATLPTLIDECSVTPVAPTATDLYAGPITGTTGTPFPVTAMGTTIITWTYDDGMGNISTQTQSVVLNDVNDPVIPVLADQIIDCGSDAIAPTTTDDCAGTVTGTTTDPISFASPGNYVINWTFSDGNGNSVAASQNVIVSDLSDPVTPVLPDLTGECSLTAVAPTTTDACAGILTGTTTDPTTYSTEGAYVINWTFDDGNGHSIVVPQNVIVDDITDPVIPVLTDVSGECSATASAPTTTDACAGTITGTTTDPLSYSSQGIHVIQWTFDDGNGNSIVVPQNVIIDDVSDPIIPVLPDVSGECSVTLTVPSTTDDCAGSISGTTTDPLNFNTVGIHVVTWTFDDGGGNSVVATQNVIVTDITPPTATVPADAMTCDGRVSSIGLTNVSDNCSAVPMVTYILSGATTGSGSGDASDALFAPGVTTVSYTVDDGNGNSNQYQLTVTYQTVDDIVVTIDAGTLTCETSGSYQWINCADNSIIDGETASSYSPGVNGDYAVIVTQGTCSDTSDCFNMDYTGVIDARTRDYKVYPNPARDYVNIDMASEQSNVSITVFDLTGNLLKRVELDWLTEMDLDISEFKSGMYMIHIHSDQLNTVARIIKE
jgi:hypothetical protein